jgi:amidohydrolase
MTSPRISHKTAQLVHEAQSLSERTIAFRRKLHRHPELGLQLPVTQQAVLDEIADLELSVRTSMTTSAVVAELVGAKPGPAMILRGDMDALPLQEDAELEFASQVPGTMHACGHDTHVAMLAGAARLLAERRDEIAGRVLFFFQPGEEGFAGARHALDEGLLDADDVVGAFALHITTMFGSGTINVRPGPLLAAADFFDVVVTGAGGHASAPQHANDPIPAACEIVTTLQTVLSRRISTFDPAVLTVARISAGTTNNVIPAAAELEGTIRTFSSDVRDEIHSRLHTVAQGVAAAHDLSVDVKITPGYPATINDADFTGVVQEVAASVLGADRVFEMQDPIMGAEDFSYVLERHPGAMAFLGACPPDLTPGESPMNHSNLVVFDEAALATGVAVYAAVALDRLRG